MKFYVSICLLALAASARADSIAGASELVYAPNHASLDYYAYPRYAFDYAVNDPHTGDNKAQWEKREGDVVKGAYSLVEPDGSLRVVEYYADDKHGFNAIVKRLGHNLHPTGHYVPIYKANIPTLAHEGLGPVTKYEGVRAEAPLISGPYHGAVSTQNFIKDEVPVKPIITEPIIKGPLPYGGQNYGFEGPNLKGPLPYGYKGENYGYEGPNLKGALPYGYSGQNYGYEGPIGHGPILKEALYQPLPYDLKKWNVLAPIDYASKFPLTKSPLPYEHSLPYSLNEHKYSYY